MIAHRLSFFFFFSFLFTEKCSVFKGGKKKERFCVKKETQHIWSRIGKKKRGVGGENEAKKSCYCTLGTFGVVSLCEENGLIIIRKRGNFFVGERGGVG